MQWHFFTRYKYMCQWQHDRANCRHSDTCELRCDVKLPQLINWNGNLAFSMPIANKGSIRRRVIWYSFHPKEPQIIRLMEAPKFILHATNKRGISWFSPSSTTINELTHMKPSRITGDQFRLAILEAFCTPYICYSA
jgi:hypothetical protein